MEQKNVNTDHIFQIIDDLMESFEEVLKTLTNQNLESSLEYKIKESIFFFEQRDLSLINSKLSYIEALKLLRSFFSRSGHYKLKNDQISNFEFFLSQFEKKLALAQEQGKDTKDKISENILTDEIVIF